jgi:hypothetical protein
VLVELGVVEQRYDAVKEVLERRGDDHGDRGALRGHPPEPAQLAPALPGAGDGRPGRPFQASEELSSSDPRPSRAPGDRAPPGPSPLGTETARLRARTKRDRPGPLPLEHLPDPSPIRARRAQGPTAEEGRLPPVGAGPADGALWQLDVMEARLQTARP